MYTLQRKRVLAAAIATLLAAPAWTSAVSAADPAKPRTDVQAEVDTSKKSDTERSSGTGTTYGTTGDSARSTTADAATERMPPAPTTSMGSGATARMAANPIYGRSADELKGTDVVDSTGDKIGDIKEIVLAKDRRSAHAVIGVGGFLGIGEHDIAVSLEELETHDGDELRLSATKAQLEERPKYQSEQYIELKGDQAISGSITDFAAFEVDRDSSMDNSNRDKAVDKMDEATRLPSTDTGTSTGSASETGSSTTIK